MQYAWLTWSLLFLGLWTVVYLTFKDKDSRREMLLVSSWTMLAGFTEPFFVPEYWNPPSLFDLARKTGFDIESFIFAFAVGGLAVVIYEWIFKIRHKSVAPAETLKPRHKYHKLALIFGPALFLFLVVFTDLNPIYSAFIALMGGGIFAWYCRPDLKKKMVVSAFIFFALYSVYFLTLIALYPGYVEKVWNLEVLSGILLVGIPLEELMYAFGLGFLWSSYYEHFMWRKLKNLTQRL